MKISKYISVFDEELMVYNALNNSLVKLSPNLIKIFQDRKIDDSIIGQYPNEIEELKKGLFFYLIMILMNCNILNLLTHLLNSNIAILPLLLHPP